MANTLDRLKTALADRYAIQEELGAGGMATVYLAEDLKHHRKVAVKVLRPELAAVLGAERFVQEIETTANLQHPHILPLFDSGEADSFLYYVMPFIDGETLRDKLNRETQLGIDEAVKITTEVADALDYAHRNNVIHRDIKPENILLHNGRPMVADFGIALAVTTAGGTRLTETGLSLGTPQYMSPEQATGEREVTARSDVYSLGAVVYEMLVGDPPHTGSTVQAVVAKVVSAEPQPISDVRHTTPPNVDAAVQKALAKVPADRFESAAKFAEALGDPSFSLPTVEAVETSVALGSGAWKLVAIGLAGLSLILAVMLTRTLGSIETPQPLRYRQSLPQGPGSMAGGVTISSDGTRIVYSRPSERGPQLWLLNRDELEPTALPGTESAISPFFSSDGSRVGFFTPGPTTLRAASLLGGPPTTLADSGIAAGLAPRAAPSLFHGSWGSNGFVYAVGRQNRSVIVRVPEDGSGSVELVTELSEGELAHSAPEVLPNGRGVLFTVVRDDQITTDVAVAALPGGTHQVLVSGKAPRYAVSGHLLYVTADGTLMAAPFDQDALVMTGEPVAVESGVRTSTRSASYAVSGSGTLLYFTGSGATDELVWVGRDGTSEALDPDWKTNFPGLSLSPDGTRLAVSVITGSGSNIWVKRVAGGPASPLTFGGYADIRPVWGPTSEDITFVRADDHGEVALYVQPADGSRNAELLLDRDRGIWGAHWSSDGTWLLYRTDNDDPGNGDILAIRPGVDSIPIELVATEAEEYSPALSPDDRWLAYVSNVSGLSEVYVRPFPTGDVKWLVSRNGGMEPLWARSGRELFYRGAQGLVRVEVLQGNSFAMGESTVLFPLTDYGVGAVETYYDMTPDGQRFVMIRTRGAAEAGTLIVVENFFEELKAKVGN